MTPSPAVGADEAPILGRIKAETAGHHRRIERQFGILDPHLSLDDYRLWLERLFGFHSPLEARVDAWASALAVDWDGRRKTPLLRADLSFLGLDDPAIAELPLCRDLPALPDLGSVFGVLYVVEGSTLGGRIIARHLRERLAVQAGAGASFFSGYGADLDARWQAFRRRLTEAASSPDIEARMVIAARDTFDALGRWLEPVRAATRCSRTA
jgi:heme oxygenase